MQDLKSENVQQIQEKFKIDSQIFSEKQLKEWDEEVEVHSKLDALMKDMKELREQNSQMQKDGLSRDKNYLELFQTIRHSLKATTDKQQEIQYDITDIRIQQEKLGKTVKGV